MTNTAAHGWFCDNPSANGFYETESKTLLTMTLSTKEAVTSEGPDDIE